MSQSTKTQYLILGAGPAGLAFANKLHTKGYDYLVLEKESEAGGLCRSVKVDGYPFDIGGGHFLDTRRPHVNSFLFSFMPENEWNVFHRKTTISLKGQSIGQPIESNIWQMSLDDQIEYLKSIAIAGCNIQEPIPKTFIDWIYWKLGSKIAEDYMLPYNRKMFGRDLDTLGTYWLEKLPNVSFEDTLRSCLTRKAYGKDPGHTTFYYPQKYGYGELWLRMASQLGNHIKYNSAVESLDFKTQTVTTSDGSKYMADIIVTTIPWMDFKDLFGISDDMRNQIKQLKYTSIQTDYFNQKLNTDSQWIYYPEENKSYHRILVRHNFCPGSPGYWTETNSDRINCIKEKSLFSYMNKYAYPLNTISKPQIMNCILTWSRSHNVYGLGRWGEHQHYNSDVTVERALNLSKEIAP